jgi:hypothetical protein
MGGERGYVNANVVLLAIGVERTSGPHMLTDRSTPCVYLVAYLHQAMRHGGASARTQPGTAPDVCVCVCVCVCCICDSYEIDT